ncbi:uncharacterized protein LOC143329876 isoform X3 [Chaetodon auriga]
MTGPKRTWQQVKIKYKNILQNAVKKKTQMQDTGGGSPKADLTPAEDKALAHNKGRPVLEGIPGGTDTNICPSQEATRFIQVSGNTVTLLESPTPEDADPVTAAAAAAAAAAADDGEDEETISLDSRRHEDPDAVPGESQPGNIVSINGRTFPLCKIPTVLIVVRLQNSQTIKQLYATHLRRQIQLADVEMAYKTKKLEDLALESEIKRRTMRKLELEIKKLERELREDDTS